MPGRARASLVLRFPNIQTSSGDGVLMIDGKQAAHEYDNAIQLRVDRPRLPYGPGRRREENEIWKAKDLPHISTGPTTTASFTHRQPDQN